MELLHGSLRRRALHELAEPAALVGRHLGVDDLAKATEHVAQVLLVDARAEASDENCGVGGVKVGGVRDACSGIRFTPDSQVPECCPLF